MSLQITQYCSPSSMRGRGEINMKEGWEDETEGGRGRGGRGGQGE